MPLPGSQVQLNVETLVGPILLASNLAELNSEALQADLEEKGSRIPGGLQLINGQSIYVPSLEGNSFKAPVPGIPKEQSARFPFVNCI